MRARSEIRWRDALLQGSRCFLIVGAAFLPGCGSGEAEPEAEAGGHGHAAPAAPATNTTTESVSITLGGNEPAAEEAPAEDFVPIFAQRAKRDPFAPIEVSLDPEPEPEPEPEPTKPDQKPPMKLLGFVNVDGARAMVKVRDDLHVLKVGDKVQGAKVVEIDAPKLVVEFRGRKSVMNLFDFQPITKEASNTNVDAVATSGEARRTNPRISVPGLPSRGPQGTRIPGLPNAGSRPSIQLPVSNTEAGD